MLFRFAREYQMDGLFGRCAQFLSDDMHRTRDGESHLCELLVLASEHHLGDLLEKLIPRVAHLSSNCIEGIHDKVDQGVLAAVCLAKIRKSEAVMLNLTRPNDLEVCMKD